MYLSQSLNRSDQTAPAISALSRSRRAACAVRRQCALREGPICCTKHRACRSRPVRSRRNVRVGFARMRTAATAIDACLERQKQTAGLRAPRVASAEVGGRWKSELRFASGTVRAIDLTWMWQRTAVREGEVGCVRRDIISRRGNQLDEPDP
jgi:hypothetical protein